MERAERLISVERAKIILSIGLSDSKARGPIEFSESLSSILTMKLRVKFYCRTG